MPNYLIIDLVKTREVGAAMFWGVGNLVTTANPAAALIVNESFLVKNLERYDNGATTQAVLQHVAEQEPERVQCLVEKHINRLTGAAA